MNENENKEIQVFEGKETELQAPATSAEESNELTVIDEVSQKSTGKAVNEFFKKAAIVGKKVAENVQDAAITTSEKIKEDSKNRRLKKFHPITLKEYRSKKFNIPNVIKIVDDAETRNIDVCEDAIGRLVDAIYHIDNFDRTRFIRTDEIFSKALEEKLAELEHIAFCLGAKKCSIEIVENDFETTNRNVDVNATSKISQKNKDKKERKETTDIIHTECSAENEIHSKRKNRGKLETDFSQNSTPQEPRLKWFAHNDNVRNLVEMQLSPNGSVRSKILELNGTSSASMTQKTAMAIDYELAKTGIKGNSNSSIERQAQIEKNSTLIFEVIFE